MKSLSLRSAAAAALFAPAITLPVVALANRSEVVERASKLAEVAQSLCRVYLNVYPNTAQAACRIGRLALEVENSARFERDALESRRIYNGIVETFVGMRYFVNNIPDGGDRRSIKESLSQRINTLGAALVPDCLMTRGSEGDAGDGLVYEPGDPRLIPEVAGDLDAPRATYCPRPRARQRATLPQTTPGLGNESSRPSFGSLPSPMTPGWPPQAGGWPTPAPTIIVPNGPGVGAPNVWIVPDAPAVATTPTVTVLPGGETITWVPPSPQFGGGGYVPVAPQMPAAQARPGTLFPEGRPRYSGEQIWTPAGTAPRRDAFDEPSGLDQNP